MNNNDAAASPDAQNDPSAAYQAASANRNWVFAATATGVKRIALTLEVGRSQLRSDPFDCGHRDTWLSPQAAHLVSLGALHNLCLDCLIGELTQLTGAEFHPAFDMTGGSFFGDTLAFGPLAEARYYSALLEFYCYLRLPQAHAFHARLDAEEALQFVVWAQLSDLSARNWLDKPRSYALADSSLQFLATLNSVKGVFEPAYLAELLGLVEGA